MAREAPVQPASRLAALLRRLRFRRAGNRSRDYTGDPEPSTSAISSEPGRSATGDEKRGGRQTASASRTKSAWNSLVPGMQVSGRTSGKTNGRNGLMSLPLELQMLILQHLQFGDLERLRQTCHFFRSLITSPMLKKLFGDELKVMLLSHCYLCLKHDPTYVNLLWADYTDPRYPFASKCIDCAVQRNELMVGRRVSLGNYSTAWVCRWCGYPVLAASAWGSAVHFHKECNEVYIRVLIGYVVLGWTQFSIAVVGAALCFKYFRQDQRVVVSCIITLILAAWSLLLIDLRGSWRRTYHWALVVELIITGLWIFPTYVIAKTVHLDSKPPPRTTVVTLAFCGLNILFRLLNCWGNLILTCEYKIWRQNKPRVPPSKRLLNWIIAGVIFWTYPRAVEQSYPPRYKW